MKPFRVILGLALPVAAKPDADIKPQVSPTPPETTNVPETLGR
jgi:hypothetical protein